MKRVYTSYDKPLTVDEIKQIMLPLDVISINQLCLTNKAYFKLCQDDDFWQDKYNYDGYDIKFLEGQKITKGMYDLAYNIMAHGYDVYNKIKHKDFYSIFILLPILSEDTWIINNYVDVEDAYTGVLEIVYYYKVDFINGSRYVFKQNFVYLKEKEGEILTKEKYITVKEFIELIGFFIAHNYKIVGSSKMSRTYKSDSQIDNYDNDAIDYLRSVI